MMLSSSTRYIFLQVFWLPMSYGSTVDTHVGTQGVIALMTTNQYSSVFLEQLKTEDYCTLNKVNLIQKIDLEKEKTLWVLHSTVFCIKT